MKKVVEKIKSFSNIEIGFVVIMLMVLNVFLPRLYSLGAFDLKGRFIPVNDPENLQSSFRAMFISFPVLCAIIVGVIKLFKKKSVNFLRVFIYSLLTVNSIFFFGALINLLLFMTGLR